MKKVYTIILYEKSPSIFHQFTEQYIHRGKTSFDTGLPMEMLQEYCMVALDVFRDFAYPGIRDEQTAWLSLLTTERLEDAEIHIREYPWLEEIAVMRQKPEEVLGMFSEALKILDRNTVHYMIEEQQKELEEQRKVIEGNQRQLSEQREVIEESQKKMLEQQREIESLKKQLEAYREKEKSL